MCKVGYVCDCKGLRFPTWAAFAKHVEKAHGVKLEAE